MTTRSQFAISYFGANLYPKNIAVGLEQQLVRDWVIGKFVMQIIEDEDDNRLLSVRVELAPGVDPARDKAQNISHSIMEQLQRLHSEFAEYVPIEYHQPQITFKPMGNSDFFPIGVKHSYTRSSP